MLVVSWQFSFCMKHLPCSLTCRATKSDSEAKNPWEEPHYEYGKAQCHLYLSTLVKCTGSYKAQKPFVVQFITHTLLAKLLFYLCTRSIPYLFLASLNTQGSVLRTSRQSFWYQDYILMALGKVNIPSIHWARLLQTVLYQTSPKWQHGVTCVSVQLLLDRNVFFFVVQMPATASQTT